VKRAAWVLAAIPAIAGIVATAVSLAAGDSRMVVSQTALAWVWVVAGAVASIVLVGVLFVRRRIAAEHERGRLAGVAAQLDDQGRLLARLDHELKNPITAILAGVSNLDATDPAVTTIQGQASRLARLLTDLRKLAELRTVELELTPVDLESLATEVVEAVAELPEASQRTITLGFPRAPRRLPLVQGDPDLLFLALYNLLANAVKYSSAGDTIEVRGAEGDGVATVEIADTGVGIPEEELTLVWEELSRGREARAVPGSGLGLPFVRAIVQRHGGSVELRSRAREGTLVRVSLPLRQRVVE
jgi:two-component system OmpR family sensor kinase